MEAETLSNEPVFQELSAAIVNQVRRYLPDPGKGDSLPLARIERLVARLQRELAEAQESGVEKSIDLDDFYRLLDIPQPAFERSARRINRLTAELIERRPDLLELSHDERAGVVLASWTVNSWFIQWLSLLTGIDPEVLAAALNEYLEGEGDGTGASGNCEEKCLILFNLALASALSGHTAALIVCAALVFPPVALVCAAIAIASFGLTTAGLQAGYNDCVEGCQG